MRRCPFARALTCAGLVVAATVSTPAFAGDAAAAREQVKIGYMLAQDGKCEEAIPHFLESVKLDVKAVTLINLASCEEKTGRLSDAVGHWVDARGRAQAEGNAAIETEAETRAKALEPRLAKLTIVPPPGPAEVQRDGLALGAASMNVPLPVNPGAHTIVLHVKDHEDTTMSVTLGEGESKRIALVLGAPKQSVAIAQPAAPPRESESRGVSPLVWAGFGVAVVGVAVGSVTGLMAFNKKSTVDGECTDHQCSTDGMNEVRSGRTLATVSTIGFIVGGAGALVGVYGLTFGRPRATTTMAVSLGPSGVRGTF